MKLEYTEIFTDMVQGNNYQFYRITVFKPEAHYKAPPYLWMVEYGNNRAEDWTIEWSKSDLPNDAQNIRNAITAIDNHVF